jgi:hypothetical protein
VQQNAPTCTKAGRNLFLRGYDPTPTGWVGGRAAERRSGGWGLQGGAPKLRPARWGPGQNRTLPGRNPTAMRLARIQHAEGWSWFPKGAKALWSKGSTGSADSSLGRPERVRVSGQERPDWRVSGARTLTSDQPAKRLHGARYRLAGRAAPCAGGDATGNARAGSPCQDSAEGQTKFYFVCTTRTYLA